MTIYETRLHHSLLSPENTGSTPLVLEAVDNALYADGSGPLITMTKPRVGSREYLPELQSYYAAVRPESNDAALPTYEMQIRTDGHLVFPATQTNLQEIFVLHPCPPGQENPLPSTLPAPKQKLPPGSNIIMAADAPIGRLFAEAIIDVVEQSLDAEHPDFSRAMALEILRDRPDISRILVAVVDVPARHWRHELARLAHRAGAIAAAAVALKALKESGPHTLAAVAAITVTGVGAAVLTTILRMASVMAESETTDQLENASAPTTPAAQIPLQRAVTQSDQDLALPAGDTESAKTSA